MPFMINIIFFKFIKIFVEIFVPNVGSGYIGTFTVKNENFTVI